MCKRGEKPPEHNGQLSLLEWFSEATAGWSSKAPIMTSYLRA